MLSSSHRRIQAPADRFPKRSMEIQRGCLTLLHRMFVLNVTEECSSQQKKPCFQGDDIVRRFGRQIDSSQTQFIYFQFNRAIRLKANVLGYSLNQKGLFGNVVRNPSDRRVKLEAGAWRITWIGNESLKIATGILVASETEEEIFKILGVPWQEPHERVRG